MDPEDEIPNAAPAVAVVVAQPAPTTETPPENGEALAQISARIEAVETRITEGLEGEREWTQETITSLRQEVADLQANLREMSEGLPSQIATLREELTQLSHSLQAPVLVPVEAEETEEVVAVIPPAAPESEDATPSPANAPDALPKGKRRVV